MYNNSVKAAALLISAALLAAGCSDAQHKPAEDSAAAASENRLDIALASSGAGIDDGSFVQENYNGICDFISSYKKAAVTPVTEPTGEPEAALEAVSGIAPGYDVVICTGYQYAGITQTALENPDTKFILVDAFPVDETGKETEADNIYAIKFREEESGFLAGMAAALTTRTGKVAVVNAVPVASNINYMYGFESGVNYVNKHFSTGAEVIGLPDHAGLLADGTDIGGNYIGSFNDVETGHKIAAELINKGCDVIFAAAGEAGSGVLDAIKESEQDDYYIGADTDRSRDGVVNGKNVVLTSVIKNMGSCDRKALEAVADGSFKGGCYLLGADTGATGYISAPERCRLSEDTVNKIDKAYKHIQEGLIVPASFTNGLSPDNFTGIELWAKG